MIPVASRTGSDIGGSIPAGRAVPRLPAARPGRWPTSNDRRQECRDHRRKSRGTRSIRTRLRSRLSTEHRRTCRRSAETRFRLGRGRSRGPIRLAAGAPERHHPRPLLPASPARSCPARARDCARSFPIGHDPDAEKAPRSHGSSTSEGCRQLRAGLRLQVATMARR